MKTEKISKTTTVYTYDNIESYDTNVILIEKKSKYYLIDTYCGSESMLPILNVTNHSDKEVIVINTHFHWDHVWGNCCFKNNTIISHSKCRHLLDKNWERQLNENSNYLSGMVEKQLPNTTFQEKLFFHEDGLELFYTPGHTVDSISIFDQQEQILYVGDNLEQPIIYVESNDIQTYLKTLQNYLHYRPQNIIAGHTLNLSEQDIINTINYLTGLLKNEKIEFESPYAQKVHELNLKNIYK